LADSDKIKSKEDSLDDNDITRADTEGEAEVKVNVFNKFKLQKDKVDYFRVNLLRTLETISTCTIEGRSDW
jgi:hypothetical protein